MDRGFHMGDACRTHPGLTLVALLWLASCGGDPALPPDAARSAHALPDEAGSLDPARQARLEHLRALARQGEALRARLPAPLWSMLSGMSRLDAFTAQLPRLERAVRHGLANDPNAPDDFLSRLGGATQNEPSVAWCGRNAVVGFNDTGSGVATLLGRYSPSGSMSLNGYAVSSNAGRSFTDRGALVADPLPPGVLTRDLLGHPVVRCARPSTFYYASRATELRDSMDTYYGISVSRSFDGGRTFGGAIMAVSKTDLHVLEWPWMDVMPGPVPGRDTLVITYTDFDASRASAACPGDSRTAVESVRSLDGGATWSAPVVLDEACGLATFVSSRVRFGTGDDVYVAWELDPDLFGDEKRPIRFSRSRDRGVTFSPPVLVSDATQVGLASSFRQMQGGFAMNMELHGLAIDRSAGRTRGALYVSWHDGRFVEQPDSAAGVYRFGDILLARSTDGGASWSAPVRVNDDPVHRPIDQFMPALEVDRQGSVFLLFYDRRRDRLNFLMDVFLATSWDGGRSFENRRITGDSFIAITGQDALLQGFKFMGDVRFMGDHIGLAADQIQQEPGIIMAWGDNSQGDPDVLTAKAP